MVDQNGSTGMQEDLATMSSAEQTMTDAKGKAKAIDPVAMKIARGEDHMLDNDDDDDEDDDEDEDEDEDDVVSPTSLFSSCSCSV